MDLHLREFPSAGDYWTFARSVTSQSRYVFEPHVEEFLQSVIEPGSKRVETLEAGSVLFRAQLGHDWDEWPVDPKNPDGETFEVRGPYGVARMKPPRDAAREGRVNPKGIPCLYLSDDSTTAMAETRPWVGSYVSLAQFEVLKSLQIMNLTEPQQYREKFVSPPHRREPVDPMEREEAVWGEISHAFSEPVIPSDDKADYIPTQILAETFRKAGCEGIRYKSRLGKGYSFALFDLDVAVVIGCGLFQSKAVSFEFDRSSNFLFPGRAAPEPCRWPEARRVDPRRSSNLPNERNRMACRQIKRNV